jgi:DNA (cytosine-5)-methyltransferase 1
MNDLALHPFRVLALCAGVGSLELALKLAVPGTRLVGAVERDSYAAAVLVARMADASLEAAPIWSDLATFDGRPWRGAVDCITAGFPCQPFSAAGKRLGVEDDRWLWPDIARVVGEVRPRYIFVENSPRLIRTALPGILGDLAALGFDAEWDRLSAGELGATHGRQRMYLLAHANSVRFRAGKHDLHTGDGQSDAVWCSGAVGNAYSRTVPQPVGGAQERTGAGSASKKLGDAHGPGPERIGESLTRLRTHADRSGGASAGEARLANADGSQRAGHGSGVRAAAQGSAIVDCRDAVFARPWPPDQIDFAGWRELLAVEPGLEPAVRRDADGLASRLDRVRCIGNGVVPVVAAVAFLRLLDRLGVTDANGHVQGDREEAP